MKYGGSNWNDLSGTSFSVPTEADYTDKLKVKATLGNETREATGSIGYDKTNPSVTCNWTSGNYDYLRYNDNLSGCYQFTLTSTYIQTSRRLLYH